MAYDTLIIGAGMSGLAAGIRLAQFDRRVLVLERHSLWGGLNSFYKLKGRPFDSGLHALTNFVPKGTAGVPLTRALRQLRIGYDELKLGQQGHSEIRFDGRLLKFTNQPEVFFGEVAREFPEEIDGLRRMVHEFAPYDAVSIENADSSAREQLQRYVRAPELIEILMLPTCIYGSAREDDLDWDQFQILFRALFLEGFSRPEGGVRTLLDLLVKRFRKVGGELRMNSGVQSILVRKGTAIGVRLDSGEELLAERVFSSAGHAETLRLIHGQDNSEHRAAGDASAGAARLSFFEAISVLDTLPANLGIDSAVTFFNHGQEFRYRRPKTPIDVQSGVICSPNNFERCELSEGFVRFTALANHAHWRNLPEPEYVAQKQICADQMLASATAAMPALGAIGAHSLMRDTFTPRTIEHYTGHVGGAVYGSPVKCRDGRLGVERLALIGTDQGMLGIVGALLSGITIANQQALMEAAR